MLHRLLTEEQLGGDLLVRFPLGDQVEDGPLSVCKLADGVAGDPVGAGRGQLSKESRCHGGRHVCLAAVNGANDMHQLLPRDAL